MRLSRLQICVIILLPLYLLFSLVGPTSLTNGYASRLYMPSMLSDPRVEKLRFKLDQILSTLGAIPKIAHISFKSKVGVLEHQSSVVLNGIKNIQDMNPGWKVEISDDDDVDAFIKAYVSKDDYERIKGRHIVEKTDLWRLLKIFYEGGMYQDIDRHYNIPLSQLTNPDTKCLLPTLGTYNFAQDFMFSAPNNSLFKEAIDLNLSRRRQGETKILKLGPTTYFDAIATALFGLEKLPRDWHAVFKEAVKLSLFVETREESPPHSLMTFELDENTWRGRHGDKHQFYNSFGTAHWDTQENKDIELILKHLNFLSGLENVPKIVHTATETDKSSINMELLRINNPFLASDWVVRVYDAKEIAAYLKSHLTPQAFEKLLKRSFNETVHLWSLQVLFEKGGIFQNFDRSNNIPLNQILTPTTKCVLPMKKDNTISFDLMYSSPGNVLYKDAFDLNVKSLDKDAEITHIVSMQSFAKLLFGMPQVPKEWKSLLETTAGRTPFFKTYNMPEQDGADILAFEKAFAEKHATRHTDEGLVEQALRGIRFLSSLGEIPKIAHVSFKTKIGVMESDSGVVLNGIKNIELLNPGWKVIISDDDDMEMYLQEKLEKSDYDLIKGRHVVEKTDLWRLLKIYHQGGMYQDLDRHYNIPLSNLTTPHTKCLLPSMGSTNFAQDFMFSAPKNHFHKAAIELNLKRRREGETSILKLGPYTYFDAISHILFGRRSPHNWFSIVQEAFKRSPYIETAKESPPNNLMTFKLDENTWRGKHGEKHIFYKSFGTSHWDTKENTLVEKLSKRTSDVLKKLDKSPKVIHILKSNFNSIQLKTLQDLNSDWEIQVSSEQEMDILVSGFSNQLKVPKHLKTVLWKLLKLFKIGGVATDSVFNASIINTEINRWGLKASKKDFMPNLLFSSRGNPFLKQISEVLLQEKNAAYSQSIIKCILNGESSINAKDSFAAVQKILKRSSPAVLLLLE